MKREHLMPAVLLAGALAGLAFGLAIPADWLIVPLEETRRSGAKQAQGGQKEYYA